MLYSQKAPHTSPWRASYGVSFVDIFDKIDRVITASHCSLETDNATMPQIWFITDTVL